MSREQSHLNTAASIIRQYDGEVPLSNYLKQFFSAQKKYGSKDRKSIAGMCYSYFRPGNALPWQPVEERVLLGLFLCSTQSSGVLQAFKNDLNQAIQLPLEEKARQVNGALDNIFPFNEYLSVTIDLPAFNRSFLVQPKLFARIRPGQKERVLKKLQQTQLSFTLAGESAIALDSGARLDECLDVNREVVIQDLQSQRVGELMKLMRFEKQPVVWDCCAASGGKSLLAKDVLGNINLTVSDIRDSIIRNLGTRFKQAGINGYRSLVMDVTSPAAVKPQLGKSLFDLIICDAPCSGSGTWSRTPEQLKSVRLHDIIKYQQLQQSIASTAITYLKPGGYLLYITCSMLRQENEDVVAYLLKNHNLELQHQELLKGYDLQADTMFAALFTAR